MLNQAAALTLLTPIALATSGKMFELFILGIQKRDPISLITSLTLFAISTASFYGILKVLTPA